MADWGRTVEDGAVTAGTGAPDDAELGRETRLTAPMRGPSLFVLPVGGLSESCTSTAGAGAAKATG